MNQSKGRVVVYGGKGALGAQCVAHFKSNNWWVASIDLNNNTEADLNILVGKDESLEQQEAKILASIGDALGSQKLDAIICVAGGWAGGNAAQDLVKNSELMWKQSGCSSLISASLGARYLREGGLLTLTGAQAALKPTPGMIGYGMAKAAVHHLTQSLARPDGGLPAGATVVAILPITLDTPMNRKFMPDADYSTWTPLDFVAKLLFEWSTSRAPGSGSLMQLITKNSVTEVVAA